MAESESVRITSIHGGEQRQSLFTEKNHTKVEYNEKAFIEIINIKSFVAFHCIPQWCSTAVVMI
jgi:hypothetical protein